MKDKFTASAPIFTPSLVLATAVTKLRSPRYSKISGSLIVAPKALPRAVSPWPKSKPINSSEEVLFMANSHSAKPFPGVKFYP